MEELLPFVAAGLLFVLLHVAVAVYLYRAAASGESRATPEGDPRRDGDERTLANRTGESSGDRVACPTCGVPNDPRFRFCRRCVADLQSSVSTATGGDGRKRLGS